MAIKTERLTLVSPTAQLIEWELHDRERFAQALAATVPENWPPDELRDALPYFLKTLTASPGHAEWLCWYATRDAAGAEPAVLVGSIGFYGPPEEGTAEIGYAVLPEFRGQGYATEMVQGLVTWGLSQPLVQSLAAEAAPDNTPSHRVLQKAGFTHIGPGREADGNLRFERRA